MACFEFSFDKVSLDIARIACLLDIDAHREAARRLDARKRTDHKVAVRSRSASARGEYLVYLVSTGIFTDDGQPPLAEYTVADDTMPRFRPKAFIAQNGDAGAEVSNAQALWECNRRIGRGNVLSVTAMSWRDSDGVLYRPNTGGARCHNSR
ncbi:hypothetical protein [Paraburkholderia atlantica]|uniref:hypothetical protein n=1 Tax=Paraburkholderia atlantica TaxID=2654982 RepID=UPI0016230B65|nr:hypothetical protein [Paraburkholderia atlantica]MBB5510471.1 prophage tail gpP-like protein [Paraburkholderia atlantica]